MPSLFEISTSYEAAFLSMIDEDVPDHVIEDTLEGLEFEFEEKGRNIAAFFQNLEADAKAMKTAEARIKERRQTLERKIERIKDYLRVNMARAGITAIECPYFCVKLGAALDVVEIEDADKIPEEFITVKTTSSPNKTTIKAAIKSGQDVPGAILTKGKPRLTIK